MVKRVLGVLSYIGMALVFGALLVRARYPDYDQYAIYAAWTGLALVLIYTIGQWREIAAYFKQRNARYGALAGFGVIVVLGILVAVNYLSTRRNTRWDLTTNRQYSLSEQTVKLAQGLKGPVKFTVFDQPENFDRFRPRLESYRYASSQVQVEYVDAVKNPMLATAQKVDTIPTIIIEYMGRTERVSTDSEQDLTNALIKLLNPTMRKVYFLSGHGEKDPASSERTGYSGIGDALKRDNYQFDKLVLAQTNEIPSDATMIVVAGPRTDILEQEQPILEEYLSKKTGKLLVMLDPPDNFKQPTPMPRLRSLLKEWAIDAIESVVVDLSGRTQVATVPVSAPPYPSHPITRDFNLITMFPLARAVVPAKDAPAGRSGQSFVQTAQRSWGETNFASLEDPAKLSPDPDKGDVSGPVSVAVATAVPAASPDKPDATPASDSPTTKPEDQGPKPETRVAAFGDSDFAANAYLGIEGNRDLFMNTVNWLSQQENLISIRPREAADRRITLTANASTSMFWLTLFVIPGIVLGAGIFTWWRRR
jgi:gliding motility-associatede transport system auxiliary component